MMIISWFITKIGFKNQNILSCGLTGYNGLNPPNLDKLKIIALFNESRGKHSCGVFSGGKIIKGANENNKALISDLLQVEKIPVTKNWNNVMIHTRAATYGEKTLENAHPFEYNKGKKKGYFCHNGTLKDWKDLAKKYNLKGEDFKVDSKFLGNVIFESGNFDILGEYKGAAAAMYCDNINKNRLYVWKGGAGEKEERPLYIYKDLKNKGIYISSLVEPLWIIADDRKQIFNLNLNTLYVLENGEIQERIVIKRDEKLHEDYKAPISNQNVQNHHTSNNSNNTKHFWTSLKNICKDFITNNKAPLGYVYFKKGRFWTKKTQELEVLMHGTHLVEDDGLLSTDVERAKKYYFFNGYLIKNEKLLKELEKLELEKGIKNIKAFDLINKTDFPFPLPSRHNQNSLHNYFLNPFNTIYDYENTWVNVKGDSFPAIPFEDHEVYLSFTENHLEEVFFFNQNIENKENVNKSEPKASLKDPVISDKIVNPFDKKEEIIDSYNSEENLEEDINDIEEINYFQEYIENSKDYLEVSQNILVELEDCLLENPDYVTQEEAILINEIIVLNQDIENLINIYEKDHQGSSTY